MSAAAQEGSASPKSGGFGDLGPRVASAIVLVAMATATAFYGGVVFAAFWLVVGCAVLWEWQTLIGGERRLARVVLGCVALAASAFLLHAQALPAGLIALSLSSAAVGALAGAGRRIWAASGVRATAEPK